MSAAPADRNAEFAARWPLAQAYGWRIGFRMCTDAQNEWVPASTIAYVRPPPDYYCAEQWAASYETVTWNGERLNVPHWFWEDDVLRYGTRITKTREI